MSSLKKVFDELFQDVKFDAKFHKKVLFNNIEFITKNAEYKHLFGSKLVGNHILSYTTYDKNIFYSNLFDMSTPDITQAIEKISTINKSFKIARDDVNLVCFYVAHRFLSNKELKKEQALEYAKEILNYFSYRTLVLISSTYFVYPISEEKAVTLAERLSNKYIIKRLKNWNEYCMYRSEEYLNSKFKDLLLTLNNDKELPNAITDLYNRTKDTLKNIYREFLEMNEDGSIIKSKKNVITDNDGKEVIVDRLDTPDRYFVKLENIIPDKSVFIKRDYIIIVTDIVANISHKQLEETLKMLSDYSFSNKDSNKEVLSFISGVLVNTIAYLNKHNIPLQGRSNALEVINTTVGNILYTRGINSEINKIKDQGDDLIKNIYKHNKRSITDRNVKNLRNGVYMYIVLIALLSD